MARWYRRRRTTRRSGRRGGSVGILIALLIAAVLLLVVLNNGGTISLPFLNLPPLPNVTIPITGLPTVVIPTIQIGLTQEPNIVQPGISHGIGQRTKTSGCAAQGGLPDPACTPGAVFPGATAEQVCRSGYASSVRNVSQSTKDDVYAEYGITSRAPGQYEVDHLVPLELGGSNDIANLWPELSTTAPGSNEKDKVENYLHDQVCAGKMNLQDAQNQIATNWIAVYNNMPK